MLNFTCKMDCRSGYKMPALNARFGKSGGVTARQFGGERKSCTFVFGLVSPRHRQAAGRYLQAGGQRSAIGKRKKQSVADNDTEI